MENTENGILYKKTVLEKTKVFFKSLTFAQSVSVMSLVLLAITLPIGIALTLNPIKPFVTPASTPATPTFTATPTIIGNKPVIITELLPSVSGSRNYRARLEGYDLDIDNILTFSLNNAPIGLSLTNCRQNVRNIRTEDLRVAYLRCDLTGSTNDTGSYEVMVTLSDGNNKTVKYINLTVSEK